MPKKRLDKDEDDEDDDPKNPFDFFKIFSDPNQWFKSKKFKHLFNQIFDQIAKNLPPEFRSLSPEDIMKEFMKNQSKFGFQAPFMAGFNINFGPDGKPIIDSFGNIKPTLDSGEPVVDGARDPLIEVNELDDKIIIIAEMPGVTKEDIELKATSNSITISTKSSTYGRKYYKEIDLPAAINSDYAKARYINGILEVELKKLEEERKNIKID